MKITFLAYNVYGVGGTVRSIVNTANYLVQNGYQVEVVSIKRTSFSPVFDINKEVKLTPLVDSRRGFETYGLSIWMRFLKWFLSYFPSLLIHRDEDLYQMHNLFTDFLILRSLKKLNCDSLVTTFPSLNVASARFVSKKITRIGQEHKQVSSYTKSLARTLKNYKKLDVVVCVSEEAARNMKSFLQGSDVDVCYIPNGVNPSPLCSSLNSNVIVSMGRLVHEKGFDLLIKAFSRVIAKNPYLQLRIYGEGPARAKLKMQIEKMNLSNSVLLMGKTNQVNEVLSRSALFVLSSRSEAFGMVLVEAMMNGVPCLAFDCEGSREIISHDVDGVIVKNGDTEALANFMLSLIGDREKLETLAKKAKEKASKYSVSTAGYKWINLLSKIENS